MSGYSYADLKAEGSEAIGRVTYRSLTIANADQGYVTLNNTTDLYGYTYMRFLVVSTVGCGVKFQYSSDGSTWTDQGGETFDSGNVATAENTTFLGRYIRLRINNGNASPATYQVWVLLYNKKV